MNLIKALGDVRDHTGGASAHTQSDSKPKTENIDSHL